MKVVTTNSKARRDYEILDKFEAGIELKGTEVKSLRNGSANINDAYCIIRNGEIFIENMHIPPYAGGNLFNHDPLRRRKLLMHKKEIIRLDSKVDQKGLTIIPLRVYFNDKGKAKVEIALAKGKHLYDKREEIAKKEVERTLRKKIKYE
ncbi:MAG: SsrA-binding protein [Mesoaciditoga sp.]|uniref:SsrA-binding protein SmpB n=2 Tax=Athalassotoga sp. TaxID=2022597 RepID=UPI000CB82FBC|nr:MAG: SsrA-binding protein [Mesoaciditoga sp.]PMP70617.1 MAG: SsrA-binding protein [Mesoaciditoga sp.]PMP78557.1 MAG: SsrA-binding protein [Mesoaciditoga sp.]PMP79011.1 MAG: SsrA-binding protein [Mesoaciditoga sp.]HEU24413.1 SsrA-binding protein SmpB [Mesoaciditoga lauensis]